MKNYLFVGEYVGNNGPTNVNLGIVSNLTEEFSHIKASNKYLKVVEIVLKVLRSRVVVVSGISPYTFGAVKLASILGKKSIYIMHGCLAYETKVNNLSNMENAIKRENKILDKASLILAVSRKYSEWVGEQYPQYKEKIAFVNNGVMPPNNSKNRCGEKKRNKIAVVGGERPQKNNLVVSEVVETLAGELELYSYGRIYNPSNISKYKWTNFTGLIPKEELLDELCTCNIFVLNSIVESFGLTIFDALNSGCSVLISDKAGATDLLDLQEMDIIYDPFDKEEIKEKLMYLLDNPNNERILAGLNYEELSFSKSVKKIQEYCEKLLK